MVKGAVIYDVITSAIFDLPPPLPGRQLSSKKRNQNITKCIGIKISDRVMGDGRVAVFVWIKKVP